MTSDSAGRGLKSILVATAIAGVFGYAIQLLAPRLLEDQAAYVAFSIFWSTLYLCVSAMSGVQQEVARASHPATAVPTPPDLRTFTLGAAAIVIAASAVIAVLFGDVILPGDVAAVAIVLAVGLVGYLANAVLSGVLYGLHDWTPVAGLVVIDVAIRAVLVIAGFALQLPIVWLALFVALPFGASFCIVWLWVRRRVIGGFRLDVPLRRLSAHVVGTVGASTASGVMITGLPMLIGITAAGVSPAVVGSLILAITLTRAPIVIPVIALQSFLISVVFRGGTSVPPGRVIRVLLISFLATVALATIGWFIGPPLIAWISAGRFALHPWMAAVIVASAALVAAMCVTGPALIAARRHAANLVGWAVAAALTVGALVLTLDEELRVAIALIAPPLVGLGIHSALLIVGRDRRARDRAAAA